MIRKILLLSCVMVLVLVISGFAYYKAKESPNIFAPSTAGLYHSAERSIESESLRSTESGKLIGFSDNYDTFAWLGVPYAAPPIGDLRWKGPREPEVWNGTRQSISHAEPCIQYWGQLAGVAGEKGKVVGSEDCLYLNIWAPKSASSAKENKKLPVMVWIHGGGNDSGTANTYQGHHLAGSEEVIVVMLNYRLGLFGWLSHPALRAEAETREDASGNFGTLDIIQALKWVQNNISEFGGDPSKVTIFGESAGGKNVFSMLVSPLASGLFHRAISQSGSADTTLMTLAEDFPEEIPGKAISGLRNSSNGLISLVLEKHLPNANKAELSDALSAMSNKDLLALMRKQAPQELMRLAADNLQEQDEIRVG